MSDITLWQAIEGQIESLKSTLQSLPNEMRTKAMDFMSKTMHPVASSAVPQTESDVKAETEPAVSSFSESKVGRRKRGEAKNTELVFTSATRVSKRLKKKKDWKSSVSASADTSDSVGGKKKRASSSVRKQRRAGQSRRNVVPMTTAKTLDEEADVEMKLELGELTVDEGSKCSSDGGTVGTDTVPSSEHSGCIIEAGSTDRGETNCTSFVNTTTQLSQRKRGRQRKSDGSENRKTIGRPRFSSYPNGYIPKPKSYRCPSCSKMLASRQSLREHCRRHTGEGFVCDLCGQKFTTNSGFLLHKKYHGNDPHIYKCKMCHYAAREQQLLDEHYQFRHDPNRPKHHVCYMCGKCFHTSVQLEKHLISHSTIKPYACDQCDFVTAYENGLAKHKYNVHEVDRKLFECELCHVQLRSKGTYVEHIGRHFNHRKKKCEICEKVFPTASQLASHRRCHSDPRIECIVCGKLFRNKHKLRVHMLVHSGQKDFACPFCSYITYVTHNLRKHCLTKHKVDYPPAKQPRMTKFCLLDSESVIASVKDPVALDCINKLTQNAANSVEVNTGTSQCRTEQVEDSMKQEMQQDSAINVITEQSTQLPKVDTLPSSANQDLSTFTPLTAVAVTNSSNYDISVLSQGVGQQTSVASEIPLFIAPHDLLSLPVITLPLVACSIASSADVPTLNQPANSDKSYVTVAAVGDLNSLPENVLIKPTY